MVDVPTTPPPVTTALIPDHLIGKAEITGLATPLVTQVQRVQQVTPSVPMVRPSVGGYSSRLKVTRDVPAPQYEAIPENALLASSAAGQSLVGWAKGFLDGESRGNFNAWFGNANNKENIQELPLSEILRRQDQPGNDAAGILQIVPGTLRHVMATYGYNPNDKFDAVTQLEMTLILMEEKGLSRWLNNEKSTAAMADDLASVWAAFKTTGGRGVYDGDGVNSAFVGHNNVKQNLEVLRGIIKNQGLEPLISQGITAGSLRRFLAQNSGGVTVQETPPVYANIPDVDSEGRPGQVAKFVEWNPDPIGNHEINLGSVETPLQNVVRLAEQKAEEAGVGWRFVAASGRRSVQQQQRAVSWGWSKTTDSAHLRGEAVDLWPVVDGKVTFDTPKQRQIVEWMKEAAKELGIGIQAGADWTSFPDLPDFRLS